MTVMYRITAAAVMACFFAVFQHVVMVLGAISNAFPIIAISVAFPVDAVRRPT